MNKQSIPENYLNGRGDLGGVSVSGRLLLVVSLLLYNCFEKLQTLHL